jgi:hypothetical protein
MATQEEIQLDISGTRVRVRREVVSRLAAAAAGQAGVSSRHRELSLLLGRGLDSGRVTLSRSEARALRAVLEEEQSGFGAEGEELLRAASEL